MAKDVAIIIPARNEQFLQNTIDDILSHIEADTEVFAMLDGYWPNPALKQDPRVHPIFHPTPVGQRAGVNEGVALTDARFVAKLDAHCAVDQGFDRKLMQPYLDGEIGEDVTTIPRMYNLHVFDWECGSCGDRQYQGPKPEKCPKCHRAGPFNQVLVWKPRLSRRTDFARFDRELHFQYWRDYEKRPEAQGEIADVMSSVGASFFMSKKRFIEIEGLDEKHGSWGQFGTEISCKSWLSGGRQVVNKRTWFSHLFRTQPGFGFPYPNPGVAARTYSQDLWRNRRWSKDVRGLDWLIDKFKPIPDWHEPTAPTVLTETKMRKGIVYYTDNRIDPRIMKAVQNQIIKSANGHKVVSVSLQPIDFGDNFTLDLERGILTMFRQILKGVEFCDADIIFLCEHDVLYHPTHFEFVPPKSDRYYYNTNCYKVDWTTGTALTYLCHQVSQLCASRDLLLQHYQKRVAHVMANGYSRRCGFEPGDHRPPRGIDEYRSCEWRSKFPNIDIRHGNNLTPSRWRQDQFRNQKNCQGWVMGDSVPGWGQTKGQGIFEQMITQLAAEVDRG